MLAQILSVMSFLGVGFVVAWCFGREFTDHTITGLYALPTSRITIAAAKYVVLLAWSLGLSLITLAAAFALAPLAGLPAPSTDVLAPAAKVLAVGVNGALLAYPLAFIASAARGYLPAVAGLILIVVITQILTVLGVGAWGPVRRHQPVGRDGRPRGSRHHRAAPPCPHPTNRRRRRRIHSLVVAQDAGGLTWQQRQ
jgi:ABC-2 type transport system permease protein